MIRSSRLAPRPILSLALTASAALACASLLPERAGAQAMGGLGHRTGGSAGARSSSPQPPSAPTFTSPMANNTPMMPSQNGYQNSSAPSFPQNSSPRNGGSYHSNAPIFTRPGGGYQTPPASVAPLSPPPVTVNSVPQYPTNTTDGQRVRGWRGPGGNTANAPRRTSRPNNYGPTVGNDNAPVYGYSGNSSSVRVTTPIGQRTLPPNYYYNNDYFYNYNAPVTVVGGPALLGGYYYGNYCDTYVSQYCYPSVFSVYVGFPRYIASPSLIVIGQPYYPTYYTDYLPFYTPTYQVTYNQNNYYVASPERAQEVEKGGETAQKAIKAAFPADSYQAAFADIETAWREGRITPLRKHLREDDVKLSVYFQGKYSYSIASADFSQITRDAFDRLNTVSFQFTRLRKAKNGDVTAYGKHVYRATGDDASGSARPSASDKTDDTVPFSTDGSRMYDNADDPAPGVEKTVYVSYTLRRHDDQWYIVGVNSSPTDMVK